MASLSIIGMPHVGNSYFSRCAVDGPSLSFRGLHPLGVLHPARAHWATPPPPLAWPSLPHYVPSTVLTLLQYLLRSHLLTYRAAPCSAETRWGAGPSRVMPMRLLAGRPNRERTASVAGQQIAAGERCSGGMIKRRQLALSIVLRAGVGRSAREGGDVMRI